MGVDIAKAQAMWATARGLRRSSGRLGRNPCWQIALTLPIGGLCGDGAGTPPTSICENQINTKPKSNYTIVPWPFPALISPMRTAIDDLPYVSASRMRAAGLIRPDDSNRRRPVSRPHFHGRPSAHPFPQQRRLELFHLRLRPPLSDSSPPRRRPRLQTLSGGQRSPLSGRRSIPARAGGACGFAAQAPARLRLAGSSQAAFALQQAGASLAA